ncbi:DUF2561 family protein [Mycobacterium botniense]|uniref:DUF2561 domain-containing protein n=1 Tax=Mycobacterium botniense TaxID=84962 RepID=A0A7I9Y0H2_9MYCO|nr:DUF2561 family protein [Mycobacterium botniense]GFG75534.1 hypothetical protein MBOT_28990 [Mycobacterium botniense]
MVDRTSAVGRGWGSMSLNTTDRVLIGVCAVVWLLLVGVSVAAIVALVDLGRGFHTSSGNAHTPPVLYAIIVVSTLVILGAVPMLLRARRTTWEHPSPARPPGARAATQRLGGSPYLAEPVMVDQARTERLTTFGPAATLSDAAVDRIWLRGTLALLGTMGAALVAVAAATYLMAIGRDGAAWTGYGLAGFATAAMIVIPWHQVRRLRRMLAGDKPSL